MRRGVVAAGAAVLLLCAGCADAGEKVSESYESAVGKTGVAYDEGLSKKLRKLSREGGTAKLADLTVFNWEKVHVFFEGATAEEVERAVGEPVLDGKRYYDAGNLLVFEYNGKLSKAVSVIPDLLAVDGRHTWGAGVVLTARAPRSLLALSER
ncbi:hypothetical protein [Streptomyces diacarni]|uniref:hypothetical protein n=1 Tax=Streptomyces diacarni TaxID=2800381 RepID=UPI0011C07830|nr:hypothetical protein [Streptomyces diacarni]